MALITDKETDRFLKPIGEKPNIKTEYWPIKFYGINRTKPMQAKMVKELVAETYEKLRRAYLNNITGLQVHLKPYDEGFAGKAKRIGHTKWSIRVKLEIPSKVFIIEHADFHLDKAMSLVMKKLEREVQDFKVELREKSQNYKKGRRAIFERFIRKKKEDTGGLEPFPPLVGHRRKK